MDNELLFTLMEDSQFTDVMSMDIINEGATWETVKAVINADTKKIKTAYKEANTLYKQGDKSKALVKIKECKAGYMDLKKTINSSDDTFWSSVAGYLVEGGIFQLFLNVKVGGMSGASEWAQTTLLKLVGTTILPGPGVVMAQSIKLAINKSKGVETDNIVKSEVIRSIDENIKMCEKLEDAIKSSK